ncbi:MAG: hypothetical protein IPJ20_01015 [Flammeovirgaceae bacterium]|nr:hypothetical protein [Flammeovirgaceae bacterium]
MRDTIFAKEAGKDFEGSKNWRQGRRAHGYDPAEVTDMRGIFYAQGPNIKAGIVLAPFQNINVYPLVAKIFRIAFAQD